MRWGEPKAQRMYDTAQAGVRLPTRRPYAVAGYIDGEWQSFGDLASRYPRAHHVSITVSGGKADCLDIERGNAIAQGDLDAIRWAARMRELGADRPILYGSDTVIAQLRPRLKARELGIGRENVRLWVARPQLQWLASRPWSPEVVGDVDAVQCCWLAHYDVSVLAPDFFGSRPLTVTTDVTVKLACEYDPTTHQVTVKVR